MGPLAIWIYGMSTNQDAIKKSNDQSQAYLLASKVFSTDLKTIARCQLKAISILIGRTFHSIPPLLILCIPFLWLTTQLGAWFDNRPIKPGESVVVTLRSTAMFDSQISLITEAPGIVLAGPVRDLDEKSISWKISGKKNFFINFKKQDNNLFSYNVPVTENPSDLMPFRKLISQRTIWGGLFEPQQTISIMNESGLSSEDIEFHVYMPKRIWLIAGLNIPWIGIYIAIVCLTGWLLKPLLNVKI